MSTQKSLRPSYIVFKLFILLFICSSLINAALLPISEKSTLIAKQTTPVKTTKSELISKTTPATEADAAAAEAAVAEADAAAAEAAVAEADAAAAEAAVAEADAAAAEAAVAEADAAAAAAAADAATTEADAAAAKAEEKKALSIMKPKTTEKILIKSPIKKPLLPINIINNTAPYKVIIGTFHLKSNAILAVKKFKSQGIDCFFKSTLSIKNNQKDKKLTLYQVQAGAFSSLKEARSFENSLDNQNIENYIINESTVEKTAAISHELSSSKEEKSPSYVSEWIIIIYFLLFVFRSFIIASFLKLIRKIKFKP